MPPPIESWERQRGESPQAYAAFLAYRDMGLSRSISLTAKQVGKSEGLCGRWSASKRWVDRCLDWDRYREKVEQDARNREIARVATMWQRRHDEDRQSNWEFGRKLKQQALEMLEQPITKKKAAKDGTPVVVPAKWTKATLVAMVKAGDELCTKSTLEGMDDLRGIDVAALTVEEAKTLLERSKLRQEALWKPKGDQ